MIKYTIILQLTINKNIYNNGLTNKPDKGERCTTSQLLSLRDF